MEQIQQHAALQREEVEAELAKIKEEESLLRDHLSISLKVWLHAGAGSVNPENLHSHRLLAFRRTGGWRRSCWTAPRSWRRLGAKF